jgi:hypothetical protein
MKNATIRISRGGFRANHDMSADFPVQAAARHHTYCPAAGSVENRIHRSRWDVLGCAVEVGGVRQ